MERRCAHFRKEKVFKQLVLKLNTMNDTVVETIENRVRSMTFAEALHGYEQYEHALRSSASILIQSRIDLDHLCQMNPQGFSPAQFERYSRLKLVLIRNLRHPFDDDSLPDLHCSGD